MGCEMSDAEPTLTHIEPTCTEKLLSVRDNSDASVIESMSSDVLKTLSALCLISSFFFSKPYLTGCLCGETNLFLFWIFLTFVISVLDLFIHVYFLCTWVPLSFDINESLLLIKKKKKKVLEREQTYLMRKDPAMVDYNVDKIEVAISGLFSLEVVAELRVERGHGFYVLNRGLLIQRAELSESHCEQQ